jgi:hypothetical protein
MAAAKSMAVTSTLTRAEAESNSRLGPTSNTVPRTVTTPLVPSYAPPVLIRPPEVERIAKVNRSREIEYNAVKIANFESKEERNDYDGGYFGIWNRDPDDVSQGCRMSFTEPGLGNAGNCLRLDYDVDSFHDAYNGFWLLFIDLDLTAYSNLCFYIRSDTQTGSTANILVELKNEEEGGRTFVDGITTDWKLVTIPLLEFGGINDWTKMTEFVIVFEDKFVTKKVGSLYIDNIYFESARPKGTVDMADPRLSREEESHAATRADVLPPPRSSLSPPGAPVRRDAPRAPP